MARRRRIHVEYKKLGGRSWGWAHHDDFFIEVDERAKGKKRFEIIVHEALHLIFPEKTEEQIIKAGVMLTNTLWHEGYRAIDNTDIEPLQDGKM